MSKEQEKLQNLLMNMKPSEWPKSLRDYVTEKTRLIGASGGVISDLIEMWITE